MEDLDLRVELSKEALIKHYNLQIRKTKAVKKRINNSDLETKERILRIFELNTIISQYKYLIKLTKEHFKDKGE